MTAETSDYVLASYREIAVRFGLSGTHAARRKVKRLGWSPERATDPAHPFRIRVPRSAWGQAADHRENRCKNQRSTRWAVELQSGSQDIESLERVIESLRRRLERPSDIPAARVDELRTKLEAARVRLTDLRLTAAIARTQAAVLQAEAERPRPRPMSFLGSAVFGRLRKFWHSIWRRPAVS
jgi:hypothetical protein